MMTYLRRALLFLGLIVLGQPVAAQNYPNHPIRLISPNPVGGANDTITRIISAKMAELLNTTVVIDNRGGAGGKIGADLVAHAKPDGYTLLAGSVSTHSFAPAMSVKLSYDPIKDFAPISLFALVPNVLVVNAKLPVKNLKDLVALAKAKPKTLNYASGGVGSTSHFAVAMFVAAAGIADDTVHVPYRGGAPALTATMAGETQFYCGPIAGMVPYIKSGALRPLAISGEKRSASLPDIPTMSEAALPEYKSVGWFGLLAPARTDSAIIIRLSEAVAEAIKDPKVIAALRAQGIDPKNSRPAEFAAFIQDQLDLHRKLAKQMHLDMTQ
jgi:tripartite-type tricarboxylate transporter receptor subunit TctC